MLFLKSFWTIDELGCKKYVSEINKIKINENFHPYLVGRYFACNLLYEFYYGDKNKIDQIYETYLNFRSQLPKQGKHFLDFPASEYIISEALLQIRAYVKCVELIELAFKEFSLKMEFMRKGYYRQMQLLWLIAHKKLKPNLNIESQLQKVKPENFYFISQKFFSTLYHYAKGTPQDLEKAKNLVTEMGNIYLSEVFLHEC